MIKCIVCEAFSFDIICKTCQKNLLKSSFYKREVMEDFFVYSFYSYDDIKEFINSKYQFYGDKVFKILAELSFRQFSLNFTFSNQVYALPIDTHTRHHFSHTAILAKALKSDIIKVKYNTLEAKNIVKYAGKSIEYRQKHKREFIYTGEQNIQVILVDDLITIGTTMKEAKEILEQNGCEVLFGLALCDAKNQEAYF